MVCGHYTLHTHPPPTHTRRFRAGGEIEFDVFGKRGDDESFTFITSSPTPTAQADARGERHKLLRYTLHPGTGGGQLHLHGTVV